MDVFFCREPYSLIINSKWYDLLTECEKKAGGPLHVATMDLYLYKISCNIHLDIVNFAYLFYCIIRIIYVFLDINAYMYTGR